MKYGAAELITVERGRTGERRAWQRGGKPGNLSALFEMRLIIRKSLALDGAKETEETRELANLADDILNGWEVDGHNEFEIYKAVWEFILLNVAYTQDKAGGHERLQYPLETLRRRRGDCDDLVILAVVLLGLCGIQSLWLEAADYVPANFGYDHVYAFGEVEPAISFDGKFYVDPTASDMPLGWHEENMLEWVRVPVFGSEESTEVSGFRGFWSSFAKIGTIGAGAILAPFTGGASLLASLKVGSIAIGQAVVGEVAGSKAKGGQEKQIGAQFETIAGATTQLFDRIQSQNTISAEDYNAAVEALNALASIAEQYPVAYITQKWNDDDYKPAYERRLAAMKARVLAPAGGNSAGVVTNQVSSTGGQLQTVGTQVGNVNKLEESDFKEYAIIGLLAFGLAFVFLR